MSCTDVDARLLGGALHALGAHRVLRIVTRVVAESALPTPDDVLVADGGLALACYVDRPFVAHPSLDDLLKMHGLAIAFPRAA